MNQAISEAFSAGSDPYRGRAQEPLDASPLSVPYNGQTRMRLSINSGLSSARARIDPNAEHLVAVHYSGASLPELRVAGGEVRVGWPAWSIADWLRAVFSGHHGGVEIVLHPAVAWELVVRGGLASVDGDFAAGTVTRIEVSGGCSNVEIRLPKPEHTVPIRISGGASQLCLRRPAEVAVSVAVSGGVASIRLDDRSFDAIGGSARLETSRLVPGLPGYDVVVCGGASNVEVESFDSL